MDATLSTFRTSVRETRSRRREPGHTIMNMMRERPRSPIRKHAPQPRWSWSSAGRSASRAVARSAASGIRAVGAIAAQLSPGRRLPGTRDNWAAPQRGPAVQPERESDGLLFSMPEATRPGPPRPAQPPPQRPAQKLLPRTLSQPMQEVRVESETDDHSPSRAASGSLATGPSDGLRLPPQHVLSPGIPLQPPPTTELQPRGAIDGLGAETRQWQPRAELPSGAYLGSKGRHRWGIPPEAPALLTSLIESSAQSPRHQRAHHQQLHESAHGNALSPPFSVPSGASDHNVRLSTNLQALVSPRRRRDRDSATGVSLRVQRVTKDGPSTHASVETHVSQTPFSDAVANAERARLAHARAVRDANRERPLGSRSSSRGNSRESSASGTQPAQDGSSAFNRLELSLPPLSEQSATSLPQPAIPQ